MFLTNVDVLRCWMISYTNTSRPFLTHFCSLYLSRWTGAFEVEPSATVAHFEENKPIFDGLDEKNIMFLLEKYNFPSQLHVFLCQSVTE